MGVIREGMVRSTFEEKSTVIRNFNLNFRVLCKLGAPPAGGN